MYIEITIKTKSIINAVALCSLFLSVIVCTNLLFANTLHAKAPSTKTSVAKDYTSRLLPTDRKFSVAPAQLAIIIDDIGAKSADITAFSLPKEVTFSILPHTEFSNKFSHLSATQNREVMLHMPMESLHDVNLGEGALLASMYPQDIRLALGKALETVPHAVGVNNHMGSKLTQMTLQLRSVMEVLSDSNLFFVDSRTTRFTKASMIANEEGVKTAQRHIFLDHERNSRFLEQQFKQALSHANKHQKAILIAHPYPITIAFLKEKLAKLPSNIELITVSSYLQEKDKFRINPRLVSQSIQNTSVLLANNKTAQKKDTSKPILVRKLKGSRDTFAIAGEVSQAAPDR